MVSGPAAVGKSEMLMHLAIVTILPANWTFHHQLYQFGGQGRRVVWIDGDLKSNIQRLSLLMKKWIIHCLLQQDMTPHLLPDESNKEFESLIRHSLERFELIQPLEYTHLLSSISIQSQNPPCLLLIDNVLPHYHIEKSKGYYHFTPKTLYNPLCRSLRYLSEYHAVTIIMTTRDIYPYPSTSTTYNTSTAEGAMLPSKDILLSHPITHHQQQQYHHPLFNWNQFIHHRYRIYPGRSVTESRKIEYYSHVPLSPLSPPLTHSNHNNPHTHTHTNTNHTQSNHNNETIRNIDHNNSTISNPCYDPFYFQIHMDGITFAQNNIR